MATVTATINNYAGRGDGSLAEINWVLTSANSDGAPLQSAEWADRTVQVGHTGDAFGGATVVIQGSMDGTSWFTLNNANGGTALSFTATGLATILELPKYIRPNLSVVGAGASINITLLARRANPMRT